MTWLVDDLAARDILAAIEERDRLREKLAKYETAFAGMWIEPDGDGEPAVWANLTSDFGPEEVLGESDVERILWDALASVLPTEAPRPDNIDP